MAIHEAIVYEGQRPSKEALREIKRGAKCPINYDDIPPLTTEELKKGAAIVRQRRALWCKKHHRSHFPRRNIEKARRLFLAE